MSTREAARFDPLGRGRAASDRERAAARDRAPAEGPAVRGLRPAKILFVMRHSGYIRNYESTLRLLAARGHRIHLAFAGEDRLDGDAQAAELARAAPSVTYGPLPAPSAQLWRPLACGVRLLRDYLRYRSPRYADAARLRARAEKRIPLSLRALFERTPGLRSGAGIAAAARALALSERSLPPDPVCLRYLARLRPDAVLVTPLVEFGSPQLDWLKAAQWAGIPAALCVASWDNLTNKGLIQLEPDRIFLWNEFQKREAVELHGLPPGKVVVTGAQCYDKWFDRRPSRTRAELCAAAGLPADRAIVTYLCSSPFIAGAREPAFVARWAERLRTSEHAALREASILVRPHPQNTDPWRDVDLGRFRNAAIWPRAGINPIDAARQSDFFDTLHHSAGIVGINTSAMIEAGIAGKPVFTIAAPEFRDTQEGTLHFRYLAEGGLLEMAADLDEHVLQLARALDGAEGRRQRVLRFMESFVRPAGLAVACTPILAGAIEDLAARGGASDPARVAAARRFRWGARAGAAIVALPAFAGWLFEHAARPRRRSRDARE